jgi:hypothetical protein
MSYARPSAVRMGRARGRGGAMGDVAPGLTPVGALAQQVNRFGPSAPAAYRVVSSVFPVATGNLTPELAMAALIIYQRRATDAYNQFHDAGSEAAISAANQGFADPVGFVAPQVAQMTQVIGGFADAVGIPPAIGTSAGDDGVSPLMWLGLAAILWWVLR